MIKNWDVLRIAADAWRTSRGGPAAIANRQNSRLAELIRFARDHSPFHKELYELLPQDIDDVRELPPLGKRELMAHFDDWVTDPAVTRVGVETLVSDKTRVGEPYLGRYFVCTTAGTTGHPGIFVTDEHALTVYRAIGMMRAYLPWLTPESVASVLLGRFRLALIVQVGSHYATVGWARRFRRLYPRLAARFVRTFSVLTPLPELVRGLNEYQPAILAGYPTAIALLAEESVAGRLKIKPAFVGTGGEWLSEATRERIGTAFNCPVRDVYGATEFPAIAFDCGHGWLHVNADWAILEPVDEAYQPVPPGQPSRTALLTNLANRVQPLIRYDLGDSITVNPEPCKCGSLLPAIRVEGRRDEILYLEAPDGSEVPILPMAVAAVIEETPGVMTFQAFQTGPAILRIRLATAPGAEVAAVWEAMESRLKGYLAGQGLPSVAIERAADPPRRDATGKFRQVWVERDRRKN